ncbi:hypothetical protein SG34_015020 [Thalassomonas viridans]|uniref:Type VI secretion protein n=1 Tax=Thalassomonas viridans TaxID=137584 RepID=A0AAF0C4Z0_9GAMM|nr:hypothetical protein [Thalassomonas viridans]WDE02757.1 hypothetical protein SG34_015020 [Thalassomonas viridans]
MDFEDSLITGNQPPFYLRVKPGFGLMPKQLLLCCLALALLCGCNSIDQALSKVVPFYTYDKTTISDISIIAEIDSNNAVPVAIDFVFIYDKSVIPVLQNLKGPEWFANKAGLLLQYQQKLTVTHVEIVPLTAKQSVSLPDGYDDAVKVLMFANYIAATGHVIADLTEFDEVQITLYKSAYQLEELDP